MRYNKTNIFRIARILFFLLFLGFLFQMIAEILTPKRVNLPWNTTQKIKGFYEQEDDLDVIIFGSSHAFCSFNPYIFYREGNIKSYIFASNEQPLWLSYHYMIEAFKKNKPRVAVLETFYISERELYKKNGVNKLSMDDIPLSYNKYKMFDASYEEASVLGLNPVYNYHDRWKKINHQDFQNNDIGKFLGFTPLFKKESLDLVFPEVGKQELPPKNLEYLNKIVNLCKENGVELILTYAPYSINKDRQSHINTLKEFSDSNQLKFVDFTTSQLLEKIEFDASQDFEGGHLNIYGANKVSSYLAKVIANKYQFNSDRDFEKYKELGEVFEVIEKLPKIESKEMYFDYLKDKDLEIFITGSFDENNKYAMLKSLGANLSEKKVKNSNYVGRFNPSKNRVDEVVDKNLIDKYFHRTVDYKPVVKMMCGKNNKTTFSKIHVNYKDYLQHKKVSSLNVVVYSSYMNKVIDVKSF